MNTGVLPGSEGRSGSLVQLWTYNIQGYCTSSPALADLDGDGKLEVAFGSGSEALIVVNGEDGSLLWSYPILMSGNSSAPIAADIDSDQKPEVMFASADTLYAFQGESGEPIWSRQINPAVGASPCAADLDGDGTLEVIFGETNRIRTYDGETGDVIWTVTGYEIQDFGSSVAEDVDGDGVSEVMVMKQDSTGTHFALLSGIDGFELWSSMIDCGTANSPVPAYADINLDGYPEIVCCFGDNDLTVYNPLNGVVIWNVEFLGTNIHASPVLSDIDGNGSLEIIITAYAEEKMYAYSSLGDLIWTADVMYLPLATATIVDIDGDSELEIIQPSANTTAMKGCLQIFDAATGVQEYSQIYGNMLGSSPAVGDLDGDGFYDIVFGSSNAKVYALTMSDQGVESEDNQKALSLSVQSNPFSVQVAVSLDINSRGYTEVSILDLCGREVTRLYGGMLDAGVHTFIWDTTSQNDSEVASGLYLCVARSRDQVDSIELCLLR
jgi:outer membrane protein assembly factor BamB